MASQLTARFVRKPIDLQEVRDSAPDEDPQSYTVEASVELFRSQYVAFAQSLCMGQPPYDVQRYRGGRDGKGGVKVVRITCPGRPTLLCNAEGYGYVRYVAIEEQA